MANVDTTICNLSLSHLGVGKEISNIDTDQSQEGKACRQFYTTVRDISLKGFDWPFATQFKTLSLVEANPTVEWAYSYGYPTDCIRFRRIPSALRNDNRQSRVSYRIVRGPSGKLIYTDQIDAEAEFTFHETDAERYPDEFIMATSLLLAGYIAPRLAGGDPFKLGERSLRLYQFQIAQAEVNAVNEEQPDEEVESQFIRVREGVGGSNSQGDLPPHFFS